MRLIFLCLISLLMTLPGHAQERVRNVRIRVLDSTRLDIRYDLLTTQPGDSVYLEMRSRLRGSLRILPEFIRGDIGVGITVGSDRHITWDALANGYALNEEVQARVLVKTGMSTTPAQPTKTAPIVVQAPTVTPTESKTVSPKPSESVVITEPNSAQPTAPTPQNQPKRNQPTRPSVFAVDSAAIPTTKPVQKTAPPAVAVTPAQPPTSTTVPPVQVQPTTPQVATPAVDSMPKVRRRYAGPAWALLSAVAPGIGNIFVQMPKPKVGVRPLVTVLCYGAVAYGLMERQKASDTYAIYEQQKNRTDGEPYYQTANDHYHRYFLATRGAVLVAATDVVLTFIRGLRNSKLQKGDQSIQGVSVRPGWQAGQITAIVHYSF